MKKYSLLVALMVLSVCKTMASYEPFSQWMLFNGDFGYIDNKVMKGVNFGGATDVVGVVMQSNGNTVFAVVGKGLYSFDGKKMSQIRMDRDCYAASSDITTIAGDSKNNVWIGTEQGLVKYDGSAFTNIPVTDTKIQTVTDIAITATDKVYISGYAPGFAGGGVSFYNGATWTNYNKAASGMPDDVMSDLTLDQNGFLWAIPGRHDMGVAKFDGKGWKQYTNGNGLPTNQISAIATNSTGKIWLASPKGIIKNDGESFTITPFSNGYSPKMGEYMARSSEGVDVSCLAVEENGTIWVGTRMGGVLSLSHGGLRVLNNSNSPLSSSAVLKIIIDKNGYKWFVAGYRNLEYQKYVALDAQNRTHTMFTQQFGGVAAYREHGKILDNKWTVYTAASSPLEVGQGMSMDEDKSGAIWFPTTTDGLVSYKDGVFTTLKYDKAMQTAFTRMFMAPDGKTYLTATVGGIKVAENGKIADFAKNPNMGGASGGMAYDKNKVFWAAGSGGVSRYVNNDWETFNKKDGMPSIIVNCIMKDSKDTLWVGTQKGLAKWDTAWVSAGEGVDFPSDDFTCMTEDNTGRLWFGTRKGITVYDRKSYTNYQAIESLDLKKYFVTCISVDKNGVAWIGTENDGILKFDGKTWNQYDKKGTNALFDKITAIKAGSDGKVYAISEISQMNASEINLPHQSPEEMMRQEISKKVKMADPNRVFVVLDPCSPGIYAGAN
jgi:ligand-binding sensor domain-containing protein